nr:hypothetical protein [Nanoarchaeota archaeon]
MIIKNNSKEFLLKTAKNQQVNRKEDKSAKEISIKTKKPCVPQKEQD